MAKLKLVTQRITWENKCRRVAERLGFDIDFFPEADTSKKSQYEDDGYIHVTRHGIRACFTVLNDEARIRNENTRQLMKALRLSTKNCLIEEADEEDRDYCVHCGNYH